MLNVILDMHATLSLSLIHPASCVAMTIRSMYANIIVGACGNHANAMTPCTGYTTANKQHIPTHTSHHSRYTSPQARL